ILNRKRIGDVQYTKLESYNRISTSTNQEECLNSLNETEKELSKHFKRITTVGKGSRSVPILFQNNQVWGPKSCYFNLCPSQKTNCNRFTNFAPKCTEMEQVATFMGHTKKTHEQFYRMPQEVFQTAKIAKLLLMMERG
ncbi:unnamed protein product, partial [Tenebrio molitor]